MDDTYDLGRLARKSENFAHSYVENMPSMDFFYCFLRGVATKFCLGWADSWAPKPTHLPQNLVSPWISATLF